jgi:hypothetical protein
VYWTNFSALMKTSKTGGAPTMLASSASLMTGLAVDPANVFFAAEGATTYALSSVPIDGGTPTPLGTGLNRPTGLTADPTRVIVAASSLQAVPKVGGTPMDIAPGPYATISIVTDSVNVYWAHGGSSPGFTDGTVNVMLLGGGNVTALASAQAQPRRVAIDDSYVYWTNGRAGTVMRANKTGGGIMPIVSGLSAPVGIAVDASHVYFTDQAAMTVARADKSGASVTVLAHGSNPLAIAVDDQAIYWINSQSGEVMKLAK